MAVSILVSSGTQREAFAKFLHKHVRGSVLACLVKVDIGVYDFCIVLVNEGALSGGEHASSV